MDDAPDDVRVELERLRQENAQLRTQLGIPPVPPKATKESVSQDQLVFPGSSLPAVTHQSATQDKIALFRTLFRGRDDVYAVFWVNERTGKQGYAPACQERWSSTRGRPRTYLPLADQVLQAHLEGAKTVGVFPLLKDHTCWFLACDFDGDSWMRWRS